MSAIYVGRVPELDEAVALGGLLGRHQGVGMSRHQSSAVLACSTVAAVKAPG